MDLRLRQLPVSARLVLTCFLAMVGVGYLMAIANIYYSHRAADGDPQRMTFDDLKAVYSGVSVEVKEGRPRPSRMQEMIDGKMREFLKTQAEYEILSNWLAGGATQEAFTAVADGANKSPHDVISERCLRCHNVEGEKGEEEAQKAPFGPDIFAVDFDSVSKFTASKVDIASNRTTVGPQSRERLILISHQHMLSIPLFTLITSLLVVFTGLRPRVRDVLVLVPMLTLMVDFAGWWAARQWPPAIWLIALSGPVYGVFFAAQILTAFGSMWFGRRDRASY
ncbi:MAG: hypothetical protein AMXMBFR13_42350 [Phycisphaerae bacterium]